MLGTIRSQGAWRWSAEGKHPAARDFINVGAPSSLAVGIATWISDGYREVCGDSSPPGHRFWRFWLKEQQKDHFSCGLLRDSSDSIGRPYPFTVMGSGPVQGWEQHGALLAAACAGTWQSLEQLAARSFKDVASLERSLAALKPPCGDWDRLQREMTAPAGDAGVLAGWPPEAGLDDQGSIVCPIREESGLDRQLTRFFTKNGGESPEFPQAVFIGGLLEFPRTVVFMRPLKSNDFRLLWSTEPSERGSAS